VNDWFRAHEWLIEVPMAKFSAGCVFYLIAVIFNSYKDLKGRGLSLYVCTIVGMMSVMTVS